MKKFIKIFFIAALLVLTHNGVDYGQNAQNITANKTAKYRNDGVMIGLFTSCRIKIR